jgi:hypothetical protein
VLRIFPRRTCRHPILPGDRTGCTACRRPPSVEAPDRGQRNPVGRNARLRPDGAGIHNYMPAVTFTKSDKTFFMRAFPCRCRTTTSPFSAPRAHDKFVLPLLTTRQKCRILFPAPPAPVPSPEHEVNP